MLLLHAADLHLGKTLHERDLSREQEAMLDGLLGVIAERRPAALLLAGDLYDRSIPPPEAVRLFDSFLSRAAQADPDLTIVAIPGNHDSAARLSFGNQLMSRAGVHIRTDPEDCVRPVIVERGGERIAIWPLPFLGAGAFDLDPTAEAGVDPAVRPVPAAQGELDFEAPTSPPNGKTGQRRGELRGQAELFYEAMRRISARLGYLDDGTSISRNVLLAHCFAAGGAASESERAFVGLAEQVDPSSFSFFDYVALGHLHRFQKAGARGRYAGSPLAYSFAEGGEAKGFALVDLRPEGGFEAELIPLKPLRAMRRIEGPFSVLSAPGAFPEFRDDFVEARLTDADPILNPADPLRANFPNLLSVRQAAFELAPSSVAGGSVESGGAIGSRSILEDFSAFHLEMKGVPPDEETARLFLALAQEAERASV